MSTKIKLVSYNILASSYLKPQWYTRSPPETLTPKYRTTLLIKKLATHQADILCLQEVEADVFEILEAALSKHYRGVYCKKANNKPDGCATFFREDSLSLKQQQALYYTDNAEGIDSGHLALVLDFTFEQRVLSIANTHLKWDNKTKDQHLGYMQIRELLHRFPQRESSAARVICGDFNAQPDSVVIQALRKHNLKDAYATMEHATCNSNGTAKRIDFIFHSVNLASDAEALPTIHDTTPLPSTQEPSDHLAITTSLRFHD